MKISRAEQVRYVLTIYITYTKIIDYLPVNSYGLVTNR